jgi:hypothetical protein
MAYFFKEEFVLNKKEYTKYMSEYMSRFDKEISLSESVIHVNKYINILQNIIKQEQNNIFNFEEDEERFEYFKKIFITYKIKFETRNDFINGGTREGRSYKENIFIFVGYNILDYFENDVQFNLFKKRLLLVIGHELVHRGRYYARTSDFINFYAYEDDKKELQYYKNPEEIMAYAWMGIENMRYNGYNDTKILQKIKDQNVSPAEMGVSHIYISDLKEKDYSSYKRFLKYMYQYLMDPIKYNLKIMV